jgi:hypothetical protein
LFELGQILDIAVHSALKTFKSFSPNVIQLAKGDIVASAAVLVVVADMIFIIMDNIFRRSDAGANPEIHIVCVFDKTAKTLIIEVVNSVGRGLNRPDVERRLTRIRDQINRGDIQAGASGEEGSGLLKIASLTRQSKRGAVSFGFVGSDSFKTIVTLSALVEGKTAALLLEANDG